LQGKAVTSTPDPVHNMERIVKIHIRRVARSPGSIFLTRKHKDTLAQPMLAMKRMQPAYSHWRHALTGLSLH
jgi:hypothetical protein